MSTIIIDSGHTTSYNGYYEGNGFSYSYNYQNTHYSSYSDTYNACPPNIFKHAQEQQIIFNEILNKK